MHPFSFMTQATPVRSSSDSSPLRLECRQGFNVALPNRQRGLFAKQLGRLLRRVRSALTGNANRGSDHMGVQCDGRTQDFDSCGVGSIPAAPAMQ